MDVFLDINRRRFLVLVSLALGFSGCMDSPKNNDTKNKNVSDEFERAPPHVKYFLWVEEYHHRMQNIAGYEEGEYPDPEENYTTIEEIRELENSDLFVEKLIEHKEKIQENPEMKIGTYGVTEEGYYEVVSPILDKIEHPVKINNEYWVVGGRKMAI